MGENVKYYNVEDFNIWRRKQGRNLKSPPRANFLAAANHVKNLLDGKSINWAAFGGLAILCLGSHREMPDIHIVYDAQDFPKIQKRLELDRRVRLPRGMNSLFPAKVLVSTGPQYKDKCTENADIEVDLIPPGFYGAPPNETLRKNQVLLRLNLDGKISNFKGLSILYLVKTALQFCKSQDLAWDPKRDIKFLCLRYGSEVGQIQTQLNQKELHDLFFSTAYFSKQSQEDQRKCSLALLGTEFTPAPRSAPPTSGAFPRAPAQVNGIQKAPNSSLRGAESAISQGNRPTLTSRKSTPHLNNGLNDGAGSASAYPSPPLPNNATMNISTHSRGTSASSSPSQVPYTLGPQPSIATGNSPGREGNSRYRPLSTGNSPNNTYERKYLSPQLLPGNTPGPASMESRALLPQATHSGNLGQPLKNQSLQNIPRPENISIHAQDTEAIFPGGYRPRKSMPNLNTVHPAKTPAPVFGPHLGLQGVTGQPSLPRNNSPSFPAVTPPSQSVRGKIQQSSPQPPLMNNNGSWQPAPTASSQSMGQPKQTQGKVPFYTPNYQQRHGPTSEGNTASQGSPSFPSVVPTGSTSPGLRVVGPGGLYPVTEKPTQPTAPALSAPQNQNKSPQTTSAQPQAVFELPATTTPLPPAAFELADTTIATKSTQPFTSQMSHNPSMQPQQRGLEQNPPSHNGPNSGHILPQTSSQSFPLDSQTQKLETSIQPSNPYTQSTPSIPLPASLMIGGGARHQRAASNPHAHAQHTEAPIYAQAPQYYTRGQPATSILNMTQPYAPISTYKAYSGATNQPSQTQTSSPIPHPRLQNPDSGRRQSQLTIIPPLQPSRVKRQTLQPINTSSLQATAKIEEIQSEITPIVSLYNYHDSQSAQKDAEYLTNPTCHNQNNLPSYPSPSTTPPSLFSSDHTPTTHNAPLPADPIQTPTSAYDQVYDYNSPDEKHYPEHKKSTSQELANEYKAYANIHDALALDTPVEQRERMDEFEWEEEDVYTGYREVVKGGR